MEINIPNTKNINPNINSIIPNAVLNVFIINNTMLDSSTPNTKEYNLFSCLFNKYSINFIRITIPSNTPSNYGSIIFILVIIVSIFVILPNVANIILYVPNIIRSAEDDTPGTTVPKASKRPDTNNIIISKIFPCNL